MRPWSSLMHQTLLAIPFLVASAGIAAADALVVTDTLGQEISLPSPPDRIVAIYNDAYGQLATLGNRSVGVLAGAEMLEDYRENLGTLGRIVGREAEAEAAVRAFHDPMAPMRSSRLRNLRS